MKSFRDIRLISMKVAAHKTLSEGMVVSEMNQGFHSNQEMNEFLLGSLTEPETERLDTLSVTDPEFADALAAAEKDLIDAYVHGELTGPALEQFKSCYLASPGRRAKVEFAQAFQVLAEEHQAAEAAAAPLLEIAKRRRFSNRFSREGVFEFPRLMPQWAFALAALVLLLVGGWLLFGNSGALKRQSPTPSIASFVLTPQTRDAGQVRTLSIPAKTEKVVMELELEPNDYSDYRLELLDQSDNRTLWRSPELSAKTTGNNRSLSISVPAPFLKSQTYVLRVTGISAKGVPETVGDYPFQVVK